MISRCVFLGVLIVSMGLVAGPPAAAQPPASYTPDQVYSVFYSSIRKALNQPEDQNNKFWFNLTVVGTVVSPEDKAQLHDLANFCPPASPTIAAFAREPKLDAIYERVINAQVGPERKFPAEYDEARKLLVKDGGPSDTYKRYTDNQDAYLKARQEFFEATTPAAKQKAEKDMSRAESNWKLFGFRSEVDKALNLIDAVEYRMSDTRQVRRRQTLTAYRNAGVKGDDPVTATPFRAPLSEFSPPPVEWPKAEGWAKFSFSSTDTMMSYSKQTSERQGFGGLNLGFVRIGARGGDEKKTENKVSRVSKLSYSFELKRVLIRRPWLDSEVFFEPRAWTWRKDETTSKFPRVAVEKAGGALMPAESQDSLYANERISFALLPVEAVIARGIKFEATVSAADYAVIEKESKVQGAGSLFGIFGGGGGGKWTTKKEDQTGNDVTFSVEAPGVAVIGLISQVLPVCPNPDPNQKWPPMAWLPK